MTLSVKGNQAKGLWDLPLFLVARVVGMEDNAPEEIRDFALGNLSFKNGEDPCTIEYEEKGQTLDMHRNTQQVPVIITCPSRITRLTVCMADMIEAVPNYQAYVSIKTGEDSLSARLAEQNPCPIFTIPGNAQAGSFPKNVNPPGPFKEFSRQGIQAVWQGYDHALLVTLLLLTAGLVLKEKQWQIQNDQKTIFFQAVKIVLCFFPALAAALVISAISQISLPLFLMACITCLTVILAAVNNLYPLVYSRLWVVALSAGLVHGTALGTVLNRQLLSESAPWTAIAGFTAGTLTGLLFIVVCVLALISNFGRQRAYARLAVPVLSGLSIVAAVAYAGQQFFHAG